MLGDVYRFRLSCAIEYIYEVVSYLRIQQYKVFLRLTGDYWFDCSFKTLVL